MDVRRLTVVSGVGLCQLIAFGTSLYLLTALSGPIVADTGWSLGWVVGGYSAGVLVSAAVSALAGRYIGAGWGHRVLAISSGLFALGLGALAEANNLAIYIAAWGIMGLAMGTGLYDAAFGTVGRLYGQSARASIIQIALWGGFASTLFWPLSRALEGLVGWRLTLVVFAAIHLVVCLPIYLFVVPRPHDATASGEVRTRPAVRPQGAEWPIYLALGVILTLEMSLVAMISVHMHTLLRSRGLSPEAAVALSAIVGPSQVLARLAELTIGRRWPAYLSLCLGVCGVAVGLGLLALFTGASAPALVIYGAGLGVVSITSGTVPLLVFGPERYPPLVGQLRRVSLVVQALAPTGAAWILGGLGARNLLLILLAGGAICLGVAMYLARASHDLVASRGNDPANP